MTALQLQGNYNNEAIPGFCRFQPKVSSVSSRDTAVGVALPPSSLRAGVPIAVSLGFTADYRR